MNILIANRLVIADIPMTFSSEIKKELTLNNPEYISRKKMNRWIGDTPRKLEFFNELKGGLLLPRGYKSRLITQCTRLNIDYTIEDQRRKIPPVHFKFHGKLKSYQVEAVKIIIRQEEGVISIPTGGGKTVIALNVVSQRKQPALVIVHTKELLYQWKDRIHTFLGIPYQKIGQIGDGKKNVGSHVTVAIVNSLYKCAYEIKKYIGFLIVDECHRTPSRTFTEAVNAFDCKYTLGLSATPFRRDGLTDLIKYSLGEIVYKISRDNLQKTGDILKADIIRRETNFDTFLNASSDYPQVLSELTRDEDRNNLIVEDVVMEARNEKGICLVLTDRKKHVDILLELIEHFKIPCASLTGDMHEKQREKVLELLNKGQIKTLITTGALLGEGFDHNALSVLFLTTPVSFNGRLLQYVGRVLRPAPGKDRAKIYDYIDIKVGVLKASAKARTKVLSSYE